MNGMTQFKYDILAALSGLHTREERTNGRDIIDELEAAGYPRINGSRVYIALEELEDRGFVSVSSSEEDSRANVYSLTNGGMGALRDRIGGLQDMMDGKAGAEA